MGVVSFVELTAVFSLVFVLVLVLVLVLAAVAVPEAACASSLVAVFVAVASVADHPEPALPPPRFSPQQVVVVFASDVRAHLLLSLLLSLLFAAPALHQRHLLLLILLLRPAVAFFADVDAGAANPTPPAAVDTGDPSEAFVFYFDTDHDDDASSPSCAEDAPPTLALPDCTALPERTSAHSHSNPSTKRTRKVPRTPRERATPGTNAKTTMP